MKFVSLLLVVCTLSQSLYVFADGPREKVQTKTPVSLTAKLYAIARLMDDNQNWKQISELLREIDQMDLDSDFVRSRIHQLKKYVDREKIRQKADDAKQARLDTHAFLEARLLVVECIQEARPRLNLSWSGEVRHLKKVMMSAIFPHAEEYGEIEFPSPKSYSFDAYGYTIKNLKSLLTAEGGKKLEALFPDFMVDTDKKKPSRADDEFGTNLYWRRLTTFRDTVSANLMKENIDPNSMVLPDSWSGGPTDDSPFSNGGWGGWGGDDDDWDWRRRSDLEDKIIALKRAYVYLTTLISNRRNQHTIDEYEPLTLMMVAVSNPALIEEDPQLRDFVAGVKFKFKVPLPGIDPEKFKPADYKLVEKVNDALVPSGNFKIELSVDNKTAQTVLVVTSNLNGNTNIVSNILSLRNVVMMTQTVKFMPKGVMSFIKATPQNLAKLGEQLNTMLNTATTSSNLIYKLTGTAARPIFDIVVRLGGKTLGRAAQATTKVAQKIITKPVMQKTLGALKSEKFLYTVVALAVAADVTEGVIELVYEPDNDLKARIAVKTSANVMSDLVYLIRYRPAIFVAAALDIGHLFYDKVPSTAELFQYFGNRTYDYFYKLGNGYSPSEHQLMKIKDALGMNNPQNEARTMLAEYKKNIAEAKDLKDLEKARATLDPKIGEYAAKRLVFHYVAVTSLNGHGSRDLGYELRRQKEEYERLFKTWYDLPDIDKGGGLEGLLMLDRDFETKWVKLGGKLPEKPKPEPKKPPPPDEGDKPKDGDKGKKPPRDWPDDTDPPWDPTTK